MIRYLIILYAMVLLGCQLQRISPDESLKKLGSNPYFVLDNQPVAITEIEAIAEKDIAAITTYHGKDATSRFGKIARDGAVVIETTAYAIDKFEILFSNKSAEYRELIGEVSHEEIRYVLNGTPLLKGYEGLFASLTRKSLRNIEVVDSLQLQDLYPTSYKKAGVLIRSRVPKNIDRSDANF
ncbi:MAG: hypothetical protein WBA74_15330 [Cyclobacteriaceae bacterium]